MKVTLVTYKYTEFELPEKYMPLYEETLKCNRGYDCEWPINLAIQFQEEYVGQIPNEEFCYLEAEDGTIIME